MYSLKPKWKCTNIKFVNNENTNIFYFYYLCIKHRILHLIFYIFYAYKFPDSGSIIICDDNKEYIVVHNDYKTTITLYNDNTFIIALMNPYIYSKRVIIYKINYNNL